MACRCIVGPMSSHDRNGTREIRDLCARANDHWQRRRADAAIRDALAAYRLEPKDIETKTLLAGLVGEFPASSAPDMRADLVRLLKDQDVAPEHMSLAGWMICLRDPLIRLAATRM